MATNILKSLDNRSLIIALLFQAGWMLVAATLVLFGRPLNVGLFAILLPLAWVPTVIEQLSRSKLPIQLQLHYLLFISASSIAGTAFGMYALVAPWDTIVHVYSGTVLAWVGLYAVRSIEGAVKATLPRWAAIWAAFLAALGFGAIWEMAEYISDLLFKSSTQHGLEDTMVDIIAAAVGALIAVVIGLWFRLPKTLLPKSLRK